MKRAISIACVGLITLVLISNMNDVFVDKSLNRYYILSREIETIKEIDVQVYGSCHAYTSFDSAYFSEKYGMSSYNMSNPGEIMPSTYLRMVERFKKDKPEVVLVETWGVNAYETYNPTEKIMDSYFRINIEDIPFSKEKAEVINDFETLDMIEDNVALIKYRDRLTTFTLNKLDFDYCFEDASEIYNTGEWAKYLYDEMKNRLSNSGFKSNPSTPILDYQEQQAQIEENETLEVEADLMKYVDKIIELCKEENVPLIFYRAPYRSTANELRKANYLEKYFAGKDVLFFDLEKELEYDYENDFFDYEHLSTVGATKSTDFLSEKIFGVLDR